MSIKHHLVGLLLGAEEDWPHAFEAIAQRLGPSPTPAMIMCWTPSGCVSTRSTCATTYATRW